MRWIVLPRVSEGTYSVHSWFYVRKWAVALATEVTLETLSSLFATIYMRSWYRLMGAKIGKDSEISTNISGRYDIVEIGDKCFIADEVMLGDEDIRRGWMHLEKVKTGSRVFVGNDAVVPPGSDHSERRADRREIQAAGQRRDVRRTTPGSARRRSSCRCARRSTPAAPPGPISRRAGRMAARDVRGRQHLAADHAVHHLRHLGGGECSARSCSTANTASVFGLFISCSIADLARHDAGRRSASNGARWAATSRR